MGFDVGGVDGHGSDLASRTGQGVEDILSTPAIKAVVDRRIRAELRRAVAPARTRAQHVHGPADDPPVIDAMGAASASRQERLNPFPFRSLSQYSCLRIKASSIRKP